MKRRYLVKTYWSDLELKQLGGNLVIVYVMTIVLALSFKFVFGL